MVSWRKKGAIQVDLNDNRVLADRWKWKNIIQVK